MHGLDTLKKLNDAVSDTRARQAIRRLVKVDGLSSCCRAVKKVSGIGRSDAGQTNYYVCESCKRACD